MEWKGIEGGKGGGGEEEGGVYERSFSQHAPNVCGAAFDSCSKYVSYFQRQRQAQKRKVRGMISSLSCGMHGAGGSGGIQRSLQ